MLSSGTAKEPRDCGPGRSCRYWRDGAERERNWAWGGKGSSEAKSRTQADRAGHGVGKRAGWPMVGGGVCVWMWMVTMVLYDGKPKPRGSRSPEGRAGPVFITGLPFWLLLLLSLRVPLDWFHSPSSWANPETLSLWACVLWHLLWHTLRLPNHVGFLELKLQIPSRWIRNSRAHGEALELRGWGYRGVCPCHLFSQLYG